MSSYYGRYDVQHKATEPRRRVTADRSAADEIKKAAGRQREIGLNVYQDRIGPRIFDGGVIGKGEEPLIALLDAATDRRRKVTLDGQRVRLSPDTKRSYLADKAAFEAKLDAPEPLDAAAYQAAVTTETRAWFVRYAERTHAEDPEAYDAAALARDLARAEAAPFLLVDEADDRRPFTLAPARPETVAFYADRQFLTRDGDVVPPDSVDLRALHFDPELGGGQQLTAIFAFDRRSGDLLRHLEIHD